jgi:hypothetical protein
MAEEQEIKKLNKSVESIMKHIGAQGSPAQAKKEADQKSKTADQEAENAKKGKELLDDEEKGEKESRKEFTGTMRAGAFIWQNLSTHIFSKMNDIFGAVVGHVKEVLGPVVAVYDAAKSILSSAFEFVKGTILSFKEKPTAAEKETHGLLGKLVGFGEKWWADKKGEFAAALGKDKMPKGKLAMALLIIGAIIGGIVSAILKPFVLLGKAVKAITGLFMKLPGVAKAVRRIGEFFKSIGSFFAKLPGIGKLMSGAGKVGKFLKTIGKFFAWLFKLIPGAKTLLMGLRVGFKVLGWPIAVLFGIIDFIKGFIKEYGESGSIIDSIGAGLKSALMGFIEIPIKMIGWVIDKILSWFGVEGADSANKILDFIGKWFDFSFGVIKTIFEVLWNIVSAVFIGLWNVIGPFVEKHWPMIKELLSLIFDGIKFIFGGLWDKVKGIWDWWSDEDEDKPVPNTPNRPKQLTEAQRAAQLEEIRVEQRAILAKEKADKAAADALTKAAKEGGKAVVMGMAGGGAGGAGGEIPQIPDEVDNWGITSKNYDMEMF